MRRREPARAGRRKKVSCHAARFLPPSCPCQLTDEEGAYAGMKAEESELHGQLTKRVGPQAQLLYVILYVIYSIYLHSIYSTYSICNINSIDSICGIHIICITIMYMIYNIYIIYIYTIYIISVIAVSIIYIA
jgi:hypothetical protein